MKKNKKQLNSRDYFLKSSYKNKNCKKKGRDR